MPISESSYTAFENIQEFMGVFMEKLLSATVFCIIISL